ncbi:MAG: hypothetical protein AAF441_00940 [Pseudomonadota bacterium]
MTGNLIGFNNPAQLLEGYALYQRQAERDLGVRIRTGVDFRQFNEMRKTWRGSGVWPYFDPDYNDLNATNAFWVEGKRGQDLVFMQAFRRDYIEGDFRNWCLNLTIALHIRAGYDVRLAEPELPPSDRVRSISGNVCLHGEMWVGGSGSQFKARALDVLPKVGLILAYLQWQPNVIWALTSPRLARGGGAYRTGHAHMEPDFVVWEKTPDGLTYDADTLVTSSKSDVQYMVSEALRLASLDKKVVRLEERAAVSSGPSK